MYLAESTITILSILWYLQDIVWPGESHVPPQGVPEKFHMTIGFLEEPPFINLARPDPVTGKLLCMMWILWGKNASSGKCNVDRGIRCRIQTRWEKIQEEEVHLS